MQAWYGERKRIVAEASPNPGHQYIAQFEKSFIEQGKEFAVITQNVDNLHQRAGSKQVIELHGNLSRNYCFDCEREASESEMQVTSEKETIDCPACGGLIRPDVVWFGEQLPYQQVEDAVGFTRRAAIFLCVGTSAVVYPAAQMPLIAAENGAYVAEINLEPSAIASMIDESIQGRSGEVLPMLFEAYQQARWSSGQLENN